jgi:hypothetical protein
MAECANSHIECRFRAYRSLFFRPESNFSLYFSLLWAETTSHETASTTNQFRQTDLFLFLRPTIPGSQSSPLRREMGTKGIDGLSDC